MKISLGITVVDDKHADVIAEGDGDKLLVAWYRNGDGVRKVATTDPLFEIAVRQTQIKGFRIFLVNKRTNKAVGVVSMILNPRLGQHGVYQERLVYFQKPYRGFGYMSMLYRWFLNAGHIYMSDDVHSPGSHAVWNKLTTEYLFVLLNTKKWRTEPWSQLKNPNTQLVLFGTGRIPEELKVILTKVKT